jgi:hypothetical protein
MHLVGFNTKKFVTMHGNMNVKLAKKICRKYLLVMPYMLAYP